MQLTSWPDAPSTTVGSRRLPGDELAVSTRPAHARHDHTPSLCRDLLDRFTAFGEGNGVPRVDAHVLAQAVGLGFDIIANTHPTPHALNMTASEDGAVLFTVFGAGDREAELWVSRHTPGTMEAILVEDGEFRDETLLIGDYGRVATWLRGGEL